MFKRRQWIKIAENIILFCVLLLIFWCHFFFFASWEWTWVGREFFICEDAAFVTLVFPRRRSCPPRQILHTASPHECGQEQSLCSASIKFLRLRQIHDPSGISPVLDNALSTLLSCCSQHFFALYIFSRWSRSVTTTVNKSQWRPKN